MIQIDMSMPNSCLECRFRDIVQSGCIAAEEPGFCVFVGLSETEIVEWEDWKKKISSGRDPRCPLRQECKGCSTIFDVAYKAGKEDSMKEQDAVEPTLIREGRNNNYNDYVCPRCDNEVVYEQNYCSECGIPFMWKGR